MRLGQWTPWLSCCGSSCRTYRGRWVRLPRRSAPLGRTSRPSRSWSTAVRARLSTTYYSSCPARCCPTLWSVPATVLTAYAAVDLALQRRREPADGPRGCGGDDSGADPFG